MITGQMACGLFVATPTPELMTMHFKGTTKNRIHRNVKTNANASLMKISSENVFKHRPNLRMGCYDRFLLRRCIVVAFVPRRNHGFAESNFICNITGCQYKNWTGIESIDQSIMSSYVKSCANYLVVVFAGPTRYYDRLARVTVR